MKNSHEILKRVSVSETIEVSNVRKAVIDRVVSENPEVISIKTFDNRGFLKVNS